MDKADPLQLFFSPHLKTPSSTKRIMWSVVVCLLPAGAWGIYIFGWPALAVIAAGVITAIIAELAINLLLKQKITVGDGSAFLTGLLVGYTMPPPVPLLIPVIASLFAIVVVKHTFGGLGRNWMNPALGGKVFVMFCFQSAMHTWNFPGGFASAVFPGWTDGLTSATPLILGPGRYLAGGSYWNLFIGIIPGSIGEVSALLLILGAACLLIKRVITWDIPVAYLGSFSLLVWLFGAIRESGTPFAGDVLFHLLSGSLILGAFYMAADPVTTPLTTKGRLLFGTGCGFFTFLIRMYGGFPEGVALAVIIMNMLVPIINKFTGPAKWETAGGERNAG